MNLDKFLVKALVDVVVFLEFSDERTVDPDAAIATMESLAENLSKIDEETKAQFLSNLQEVASEMQDEAHAHFVRNLGENLGIL